jgi:polyisoprenoid-binding protein YceI
VKRLPWFAAALVAMLFAASPTRAENYAIDIKGAHAFIEFRIKHLGYSWLYGRFNRFDGQFSYDEKDPAQSSVVVTIDTASIDSNHAERDKHLRGADFLDASKYPQARFTSTAFDALGNGRALLKGNLNLHGHTRPIEISVEHIGNGLDPWGGYRRGFLGTTKLALKDFGIDYELGNQSREVELTLSIEGIRQ